MSDAEVSYPLSQAQLDMLWLIASNDVRVIYAKHSSTLLFGPASTRTGEEHTATVEQNDVYASLWTQRISVDSQPVASIIPWEALRTVTLASDLIYEMLDYADSSRIVMHVRLRPLAMARIMRAAHN